MNWKYWGILLAAGAGLLSFDNVLIAALNNQTSALLGQECIRCHVTIYEEGMKNKQMHSPFWEKQCVVCHLAEGAVWPEPSNGTARGAITGTAVNQNNLWRKLQKFSVEGGPQLDHVISIPFLNMNSAYRFRIVLSQQEPDGKTGEYDAGLWLGLLPDEMGEAKNDGSHEIPPAESPALRDLVKNTAVFRDGKTVFISWQTTAPVWGWVELQALEGISLADDKPRDGKLQAVTKHPPLRSPEDLAIGSCYGCHPESSLGASHPVRLYGGKDVTIPKELPTIEGMLTCVTCHAPHGSIAKNLVRETVKTKLCVACHYKYKNSSPSTMFD